MSLKPFCFKEKKKKRNQRDATIKKDFELNQLKDEKIESTEN